MAKYGRYDPRNKKKDRNKRNAQDKDLRIRFDEKEYDKYSVKPLTNFVSPYDDDEDILTRKG